MGRLALPLVVALAGMGLGSRAARAESACPNVFDVCPSFTLVESGGGWGLLTGYVSSPSGLLTASYHGARRGVWDLRPGNGMRQEGRGLARRGLQRSEPGRRKGSRGHVGDTSGGLASGEVTLTFPTFAGAITGDRIDHPGHQGPSNGSATGAEGGVGSAARGGVPVSATTPVSASTTTPEPASMLLLAAGLVGVALPAIRRRRRKGGIEV